MYDNRLPTHVWISAQLRRAQARGLFATVLHRGDRERGAVLVAFLGKDGRSQLVERSLGPDGHMAWRSLTPDPLDADQARDQLAKRRKYDPDLWVLEIEADQPDFPLDGD